MKYGNLNFVKEFWVFENINPNKKKPAAGGQIFNAFLCFCVDPNLGPGHVFEGGHLTGTR